MDVQCVLRAGALNGECPRWRPEERRLYWVDMRAPALNWLDPETGEYQVWPMPDWIGCYAFTEDGGVVAALRGGFYRFDPRCGALRRLADPPYDPQRFCFNDGGCDPAGRFVVGPLYAPKAAQTRGETHAAPVWRYDRGGWRPVTPPVQIANGLAWSPDGRLLYYADTAQKTIWAVEYDPATAETGKRRVFATVDGGGDIGGPDGAVVDRDGFYICALFGEGCLLRFDPDGRLERRLPVPPRYPTMPAFGGDDLDLLFVTSASFPIPETERAAQPDDGALFALEAPVPGPAPNSFNPQPTGIPL
jgi:sugar lactone lactonase YvrE